MRTLILLALSGILLTSCTKDKLTASGDKITEERFPGDFNGISTSGSTTVQITYGSEFKVVLKGSNNLIPYFKTNVMGNTLYLGYENASVQHDDVTAFVTLPSIRKVSISGSGKINLQGNFPATSDFKVSISGSGDASVQDAFDADEVLVNLSGSGKADLQQVNAKKAEVSISGSGDARLRVQEKLKARVSGSGTVYYTGNADVDAAISGSGKVLKF